MYRPKDNFNVPMKLLIPIKKYVNGVLKKSYPKIEEVEDGYIFFGSFKTFGGTENTVNGVYSVVSTANVETWYRDDIKSDCRIVCLDDMSEWEIINRPENIERRNQFLKFKVKEIRGDA